MKMERKRAKPGAIALVGSGEYLDAMNEVDAYLLDTLGGANGAKVALLPTASGLEQKGPTYWNDLGLQHFQKLGVQDISTTLLVSPRAKRLDLLGLQEPEDEILEEPEEHLPMHGRQRASRDRGGKKPLREAEEA